MNNFTQRLITGTVFVALVTAATLYSPLSYKILLSIIAFFSVLEFQNMVFGQKKSALDLLMLLPAPLIVFFPFLFQNMVLLLMGLFMFNVLFVLFSEKREFRIPALHLISFAYIGLPLAWIYHSIYPIQDGSYLSTYEIRHGGFLAMNLFILIWSNDTFAYLSGRAMGKHPLYKKVSPGKTIEGFVGGVLCTLAVSYVLSITLEIPLMTNLCIAIAVSVFGTAGDLVESMLKREFGVKDSGQMLPGHGGFLDRFDAFIFVLPVVGAIYQFLPVIG